MGKPAHKQINRTGFTFYKSYYDIYQQLSDEQKIQFVDAILEHQFTDMDTDDVSFEDAILNIAWLGIKPNLVCNKTKFLNGSKPKNKRTRSEKEAKPKRSANNVNENVNENENDNGKCISLTLNDKSEYEINSDLFVKLVDLYPSVDTLQELRKMKGWLMSNPTKRKTRRGVLRFVNNWLSREQDRRASQKDEKSNSYGAMEKTIREQMNKPNSAPLTTAQIKLIRQQEYDEQQGRLLDVHKTS